MTTPLIPFTETLKTFSFYIVLTNILGWTLTDGFRFLAESKIGLTSVGILILGLMGASQIFANVENLFKFFDMLEQETKSLLEKKLSLPAYDQCLKASHVFNILDARGAISVAQRAEFISRIRDLTKGVGQVWVDSQK